MKRITTLLASAFMMLSAITLSADNEKPSQQTTPIIIAVMSPGTIQGRNILDVPQAYYTNGHIYTLFNSYDNHIVTISVTNLQTGSYIYELVDTSTGAVMIDINQILSSGDFSIELLYDNGDKYIGHFTL